jgi:hypothetical protein
MEVVLCTPPSIAVSHHFSADLKRRLWSSVGIARTLAYHTKTSTKRQSNPPDLYPVPYDNLDHSLILGLRIAKIPLVHLESIDLVYTSIDGGYVCVLVGESSTSVNDIH